MIPFYFKNIFALLKCISDHNEMGHYSKITIENYWFTCNFSTENLFPKSQQ